jgi:hypothetical protein
MPTSRLSFTCFFCAAAVAVTALFVSSSEAEARGGSGAMRAYMRIAQAEAKWMQQQMQAYQKQQKEQYDAFMKRFDTNRNGKIDGKEKGPAQRYMRQIELGKDPDKAIKTLGRTSSARSK